MALSENIREIRTQKGLSLEDVAKCANITRQAMWKYEQGQLVPNGIVLVQIAEKLGTTCEELVKGKQNESKIKK
ncbi:MAG: helix-turn-helix domain-containing protein [Oscillospiraceae bacterium]|nr:helix-turn-helix domain-containing protein [Oscillospiraceae bacterium]